ncbi:MAG: hypothetical protein ACYDDB_06775 [bacterium]
MKTFNAFKHKIKYIKLYFLSITLILTMPLLFMLPGCAPAPVLNNNLYNKSKLQKKLEKKALAISLKLNGVSSKNIKDLLSVKPASGKPAVPAKSKGSTRSHPYMPPFMIKTSDIPAKHHKPKDYTVSINKTVKSRGGKLLFRVNSVKFKNIFEIIDFSLKNLYPSVIKYRLILFRKKKLNKKSYNAESVPFRTNLGKGSYLYLSGLTEIKGNIIFLRRSNNLRQGGQENLSGLTLEISAYYKGGFDGEIKLIKLLYKF